MRYVLQSILIVSALFLFSPASFGQGRALATIAKDTRDGNYKEAYEAALRFFKELPKGSQDPRAAEVYQEAVQAISGLQTFDKYDELLDLIESRHADNIPLLSVIAPGAFSYGYKIGDRFTRGTPRGYAGEHVNCLERDRVRILRLLVNAMDKADKADKPLRDKFYLNLGNVLCFNRINQQSWRLQDLTDLSRLPDYDRGANASYSRPPVNPDSSPVYYRAPASFRDARSDGERMRYAYDRAIADGSAEARDALADFLAGEFDFSHVDYFIKQQYYQSPAFRDYLNSLRDNETVAQLADGVRKLMLPEDQNYIRLYRENGDHHALASIYIARMQLDNAVKELKLQLKKSPGDGFTESRIREITGNWGTFISHSISPQGAEPRLELRFRNASSAIISVRQADAEAVFDEFVKGLSRVNTENFPYNLYSFVDYMNKPPWNSMQGREILKYEVPLNPLPKHYDTSEFLTIPVKTPGAYIVSALFEGGQETKTLVWITNEALNLFRTVDGTGVMLTDPMTGAPLPGRELTLYGFIHHYANNPEQVKALGGKVKIETVREKFTTDANGYVLIPPQERVSNARWLLSSRDKGRFALLEAWCVQGKWSENRFPDHPRTYFIPDRPVYKPGDTVAFTGYLRTPSYGEPRLTDRKEYSVTVHAPRGGKVFESSLKVDPETLACSGEFKLPADAQLGQYTITGSDPYGSAVFRVEEYKKPEYEVTVDAPKEPVRLGDSFTATITGRYYFGAPVVNAPVKYKVTRQEKQLPFPFFAPFDWLYGKGYWICSSAVRTFWFRPVNFGSELVVSGSGLTDAEGRLSITVDTSDALKRFGKLDFSYTVTAELSDSTHRVVTGSGEVIAAANPFTVFIRQRYGFYRTDEVIEPQVSAFTPDGKPVSGFCRLSLFRRTIGRDGAPVRMGSALKSLSFKLEGPDRPRFSVKESGVYELYAEVTAQNRTKNEASSVLFVRGEAVPEGLFSELPLEITSDKGEYRPGETASLLISTREPGAFLYVFKRSSRKTEVEFIQAKGYSTMVSLPLGKGDQPNTFVTVLTVRGGKLHRVEREIILPPETKMLNVAVDVPKDKVAPRSKVPVTLTVTDSSGKGVPGAFTLTVYDKSLEAIAPNAVPAVAQFFWGWKRYPQQSAQTNLDEVFGAFAGNLPDLGIYFHRGNSMRTARAFRGGAGLRMAEFAPAAAPMMEFARKEMNFKSKENLSSMSADAADGGAAPDEGGFVRSDFLDRAFWIGQRTLGPDGKTTLEIPVPDNLTTWKIRVWSLTPDTRVGQGESEIVVSKDMIARLELPRFLVQGDRSTAIANIHNYTKKAFTAEITLSIDGKSVSAGKTAATVLIEPGEHGTVAFPITALEPGEARFTLRAAADGQSDALELKLPVTVRGIDKQINHCGRLAPDVPKASVALMIPEKRKAETTFLTMDLSPGAAHAMVDLLPYLAADDSKDVFGVVNRFVPVTAARAALKKLNVNFEDLKLKSGSRHELFKDYLVNRDSLPSFDPAQFNKVTTDSLKMIESMVNADGGWGWFSGYGEVSWPDTTAYVVDALLDLRSDGGTSFNANLAERGLNWLEAHAENRIREIVHHDSGVSNTDALVLRVLAKGGKRNTIFEKLIYERRTTLAPYGLSMLALALPAKTPERDMARRNLTQFLKVDDENGTAYLNIPSWCCFFWYGNENETNAAYLTLLLADEPERPVCRKLASYLTANVRNSPWRNSTRSVGAVVRALAAYIISSGEGAPDGMVTVRFDGREIRSFRIDRANMWNGDFRLALGEKELTAGRHNITLEFTGKGAAYFNLMLNYFTLEDEIKPAGLEMKIQRKYYKLVPEKAEAAAVGTHGNVQRIAVEKYRRVVLTDMASLVPGDLVEVELISEAKNDYDYVVMTDPLPAGFEYVSPVSGYRWNWRSPVYCEYREREARFFVRSLARGQGNVFYRLRAQIPGVYLALPASGKGVYAPELKCNSSQDTFLVKE